jgi:hypothetical protein
MIKISQSALNEGDKGKCDKCGEPASHDVWPVGANEKQSYCCRCHVLSGAAPADWHPGCMKTYAEMKAKGGPG